MHESGFLDSALRAPLGLGALQAVSLLAAVIVSAMLYAAMSSAGVPE